ncbi:fumarylacetoacetate hydrolase family protein [Rhizobium sp. L1K21]|uniref:fumarylacetoacetate hydrolase family protein n=1 Tax=Rhizobium sp. L1K21 TaxID=2954933 RepID=UPI002093B010|nr:fumarylacetoacetate hydrolase family protein [Rhizobium sp. L1K21]MCO6188418.1 fumarylacetoacetate hydrolase family protein [Rhizobium sp. L1K21]
MHFAMVETDGETCLALKRGNDLYAIPVAATAFARGLDDLVAADPDGIKDLAEQIFSSGRHLNAEDVRFLPPLSRPPKIICVGLNYVDHTAESGFVQPEYPTLFARFATSLIGHEASLVKPDESDQFDYEGELAVVLARGGRKIRKEDALNHVFGYTICNDASLRDYQFKSPQWTAGKNFDHTGALGPFVVTADALPAGCKGLMLETRLNGTTVQKAPIDDMVFDVASLIEILSAFMTMEAGDIIISGTPSGVGMARNPPLWMKPGDVVEVEISNIGILRNSVRSETALSRA